MVPHLLNHEWLRFTPAAIEGDKEETACWYCELYMFINVQQSLLQKVEEENDIKECRLKHMACQILLGLTFAQNNCKS